MREGYKTALVVYTCVYCGVANYVQGQTHHHTTRYTSSLATSVIDLVTKCNTTNILNPISKGILDSTYPTSVSS